ncbi:MAG: PAS domain S-box protein [Burkholderiales bacterium]|nr:PAS domain S-box protein [Burkholderiales bacterium]
MAALLLVAMTLLLILTLRHEAGRAQEQVERLAAEAAGQVRAGLLGAQQSLQALALPDAPSERWREDAAALLRRDGHMLRIERRRADWQLADAVDSPHGPPLFSQIGRADIDFDAASACRAALRQSSPTFSSSYFVPRRDATGLEVMDLCLPVQSGGRDDGYLIATFSLPALLTDALPVDQARHHELSFVEGDGARLARAGPSRGTGVYRADSLVDLPGSTLRLRLDSQAGPPSLIPNLATALVLGLSLALFALLLLLARDAGRRARAESALAEALAFRKAMEDSLITGLRARDLQGRITYVNPAFCTMVGFSAEALREAPQPPYWPPELVPVYEQRQTQRQAAPSASREGVETLFMRRNGERFPVMIYEAPLVDGQGRHTGWMSAVVDISAQRRAEELSRQQQERLQATARLATIGEMASLLSHELNQPLAAIASYATGSLNLMAQPDETTPAMLHDALQRIAQQAERAGRVIKSVHDFVRRREQLREALGVEQLIEAVLPLVRLQARKSGTQIDADLPQPAPRVLCDRTMVEQVLLNLARNAIQAMEQNADPASRVLRIRVRQTHERWVTFYVADTGPGIDRELGARLFTPFFTTRREGMGLGLSLCRTVVEQHGGAMDFDSPVPGTRHGTEFRFTLPSARPRTEAGADESAEPQTLTP